MKAPPSILHYGLVALALFALLGATLGAAQLNLGAFATPVALAIAAAKATLILAFFMNLRERRGITFLYALAGFFWLAILLALAFADYGTRY